MIEFLVNYAMKNSDQDLFKNLILRESSLSNVFSIFMCYVFLFQKDAIVPVLLKKCLEIVAFLRKNEQVSLKNSELSRIAQNKLVKAATKHTRFKDDDKGEIKNLTEQ
jgi:hypothetical protein